MLLTTAVLMSHVTAAKMPQKNRKWMSAWGYWTCSVNQRVVVWLVHVIPLCSLYAWVWATLALLQKTQCDPETNLCWYLLWCILRPSGIFGFAHWNDSVASCVHGHIFGAWFRPSRWSPATGFPPTPSQTCKKTTKLGCTRRSYFCFFHRTLRMIGARSRITAVWEGGCGFSFANQLTPAKKNLDRQIIVLL